MKWFLLVILGLCIAGCDINPSAFGKGEAAAFSKKITYVKDSRTGLCFGIVASRKTAGINQTGMGLTQVPCEAVKELL